MIFWTCQNVPRPQNRFIGDFPGQEYETFGNIVPSSEKFENIKKMLTAILCIMAVTLPKRAHEVPV